MHDKQMKQKSNSSGLSGLNGNVPWWVRLVVIFGLPTFLLLWLLGSFPWVPSPLTVRLEAHDRNTTAVLRTICKGVWQNDSRMQQECDRGD